MSFTLNGGMPVQADDLLVLTVIWVRKGLIQHQNIRHLPRPVNVLSVSPQSHPVIFEHVHNLFLLKGMQNPTKRMLFLAALWSTNKK